MKLFDRFSSSIAIVAATLILFAAIVTVTFDKPPPPLDKNQLMVANYTVCVPARHQAIDELKASVSFRPTLNAVTINVITGQVPEVTARSAPQKAVAPTLDAEDNITRKVAEASPAYMMATNTVPSPQPLEVSRSGSFNC